MHKSSPKKSVPKSGLSTCGYTDLPLKSASAPHNAQVGAFRPCNQNLSQATPGGMSVKKHTLNMSKKYASLYCGNVKTDPQGSYTGIPEPPSDVPVQDADDL